MMARGSAGWTACDLLSLQDQLAHGVEKGRVVSLRKREGRGSPMRVPAVRTVLVIGYYL